MRLRTLVVAALTNIVVVLLVPLSASAHALPQSAVPAEGGTVSQAPATVSITFGEPPDPGLSTISVVDTSGSNVTAGPTTAVPGHSTELQVPLKKGLGNGVYTVTWKTVSAVDGHLATGTYAFGVGVAATSVHTASTVGATAPSIVAVLARLLLFVGLVVVVGAVVLGAYAFGTVPPLLRRVVGAGAAVALVGTLAVVAAQASGAGVDLGELVSSSLGRSLLARAIPVAVLLAAAIALLRTTHATGVWAGVAGVAALAAMAVDVLNSHAAAEGPTALNEFAQALHIASVGVWIGGVVALLVVLHRRPEAERTHTTRRLSTLAGAGLAVVAATGVFRAVVEVQTWGALVSTAFGVLVLLKAGLIVVLALLGAANRWLNIPNLPRAFTRLRRVVTTEAVVAVGALAVAAALVNVAPPAEYASAATTASTPASISVDGSDYATTVKVHLTVTSGGAGFNTFTLDVNDYTTGAPVAASAVELQFTQPIRPALAPSTLALTRIGDGVFSARGGNMSLPGIWEIAAVIENGDQSTEVHLQVATNTPAPPVTVTRFTGLPTIYNVTVSRALQAQVYLDPDKPGATEFHVTFTNASQNEIQVSSCTVAESASGAVPRVLVSRRLDPTGHFVADATVPAGATRFDIIATTASGQAISTFLTITPGS